MEKEIETILKSWNTSTPIIPTKQQLKNNPTLLYYENIVESSLEQDPSIIELLKNHLLKQKWCEKIIKLNFPITEELITSNPSLCKYPIIMEKAIQNNPKLLKLTQCNLSEATIDLALEQYTPTKQDLIENPYLITIPYLMEQLPQYQYYTRYPLSIIKLKEEILKNLDNPEKNDIFKTNETKSNQAKKIIKIFVQPETTTEQEQKEYQRYLEIMIDKILNIRYQNQKQTIEYPDIISINDAIIKTFRTNQSIEEIDKLTEKIYEFTGKTIKKNEIKKDLLRFYKNYLETKILKIETTSIFCNKILNYQRDYFIKNEKKKLKKSIKDKLELTEKKREQIYTRRKLKIITELIKNHKFDTKDLHRHVKEIRESLKTNKKMLKAGVILTDENLDTLETIFLQHGTLNNQNIEKIVKTEDKKIIKYIINKYEKTKLKELYKIKLKNKKITEEDKEQFTLNFRNFIINNKEQTNYEIATMLITQNLEEILEHENDLQEIKKILPFLNLFEELNTTSLIQIIQKYSQIKKIIQKNPVNIKEYIYENFDKIILLCQGYNQIDDQQLQILGKNIIKKLHGIHIKRYIDFYIKMLKKQTSNIPPIELDYKDIHLKSGDYANPERLLIGKQSNQQDSCIDLIMSAGKKTYEECLLNQEDVILIKKENELISRILTFRRGNTIQLVTSSSDKYDIELYQQIANQMLEKANQTNDNIEYIVVNQNSVHDTTQETITDARFIDYFPHSDTCETVIVLYKKENAKLNFITNPKTKYQKIRKPITENPTTSEIKRIQALYTYITNEPIEENYEKVICGEDWLLALTTDNKIKEINLNPQDPKTQLEIKSSRPTLEEELKMKKTK